MTAKKVTLKEGGTTIVYPQTTEDMVFIEGDANNKTLRNYIQENDEKVNQLGQEVSKDMLNNYLVGKNNTYVSKDIYGLVPGRTYRVVLKDTSWDMSGVTTTGVYIWTLRSSYNGIQTDFYNISTGQTISPYYDITIPEHSDYVRIGGRATADTKIRFYIFDITELNSLSQTISTVDRRVLNNSFVGQGQPYVSKDLYGLVPGRTYRVILKSTSWDKTGITISDSYSLLQATNYVGATGNVIFFSVKTNQTPAAYYDITIPASSDFVRIGGRAKDGLEVHYMILDITDLLLVENDVAVIKPKVNVIENELNTFIKNVVEKDICEFKETEIVPSASQTYNAYYRSSMPTNFSANELYLNRLTYYPNVIIKGGKEVTVHYTGRNAIRIYELPYRDLDTSPVGAFNTSEVGTYHDLVANTSESYTGIGKFTIGSSCKRLAFVLGSTKNVAISPSEITQEITKVVLPVYEPFKLNDNKEFVERVAQSKYVAYTPTIPSLGLLHFTDIHGDQIAANTIKDALKYIHPYVDDVLCTGDSVHYYADGTVTYPQGHSWWTDESGLADKSLFILGNHDGATPASTEYDQQEDSAAWDGKGKAWDFDTYIAPYIQQLGITMPSGYDDSSSPNYKACFWHKDYPQQKIRLIGLDCMHRFDGVVDPSTGAITSPGLKWTTNEQEVWLISKLNETLDSNNAAYGYSVVVCCHYPLDDFSGNNEEWVDANHRFTYNQKATGGRVMNHKTDAVTAFHNESTSSYSAAIKFNMRNRVDNGYSESQPYPNYTKGTVNNVGEILKAWMTSGGKIVAWLCGHTHMDYMWYSMYYPNILTVVCDQAGCLRGTNSGDRSTNLASRTCANYISIDTQNGLLKIVRLGFTQNRLMNSHQYFCYDYINRKVLNEG